MSGVMPALLQRRKQPGRDVSQNGTQEHPGALGDTAGDAGLLPQPGQRDNAQAMEKERQRAEREKRAVEDQARKQRLRRNSLF